MKQIALLVLFLVGLGMYTETKAQVDLDVVNNAACKVRVDYVCDDGTGNCQVVTVILGPGTTTLLNPYGSGWVYLARVTELTTLTSCIVEDLTNISACNSSPVTNSGTILECTGSWIPVLFTPYVLPTTNALLNIN